MVRLLTEYPLTFFLSQIFIHFTIVAVLVADGDLVSDTDDKDVRIIISSNSYLCIIHYFYDSFISRLIVMVF